ncbi:hypothetical protein DPEC_G00311810 [Dallia pectoralis]|uniref:Uncharacterized protein n=1 Tax=Dallia pectoralis TaxID=75939 RepID=A0ACC2FBB6_DALPE|nr:hypothetical protein DPEC_G00311810 [Dallia pectoralis]
MRQQALAIGAEVVPINITGESFERQASFRRAVSNTDTLSRRPRNKLTRRQTITGIPESKPTEGCGESVVLPGQYSTLGRTGRVNTAMLQFPVIQLNTTSNTPEAELMKEEKSREENHRVVKPSVRRIRAQRGEGISSLMASLTPILTPNPSLMPQPQSPPSLTLTRSPSQESVSLEGDDGEGFYSLFCQDTMSSLSSQSSCLSTTYSTLCDTESCSMEQEFQSHSREDWNSRSQSRSTSVSEDWSYKLILPSSHSSPLHPLSSPSQTDCSSLHSEDSDITKHAPLHGMKSQSHSCISADFGSNNSPHGCQVHNRLSSGSLSHSISLRKSKKPPPPPTRSTSLCLKPSQWKPPGNNINSISSRPDCKEEAVQRSLQTPSLEPISPTLSPGLFGDPWVPRCSSLSSLETGDKGIADTTMQFPYFQSFHQQTNTGKNQNYTTSPHLQQPLNVASVPRSASSGGVSLPSRPNSCHQIVASANIHQSPACSTSSGYSSQCNTPTTSLPRTPSSPLTSSSSLPFTASSSLSYTIYSTLPRTHSNKESPKPLIPERKSSVLSSPSSSFSSTSSLSSITSSDSARCPPLPPPPPLPCSNTPQPPPAPPPSYQSLPLQQSLHSPPPCPFPPTHPPPSYTYAVQRAQPHPFFFPVTPVNCVVTGFPPPPSPEHAQDADLSNIFPPPPPPPPPPYTDNPSFCSHVLANSRRAIKIQTDSQTEPELHIQRTTKTLREFQPEPEFTIQRSTKLQMETKLDPETASPLLKFYHSKYYVPELPPKHYHQECCHSESHQKSGCPEPKQESCSPESHQKSAAQEHNQKSFCPEAHLESCPPEPKQESCSPESQLESSIQDVKADKDPRQTQHAQVSFTELETSEPQEIWVMQKNNRDDLTDRIWQMGTMKDMRGKEEEDNEKSGETNDEDSSDSGSLLLDERRHSLSSGLSSDSLKGTLQVPNSVIHNEVAGGRDEGFGLNAEGVSSSTGALSSREDKCNITSAMVTPARARTTEDLFAAIHKSKRKVLGRVKSAEDPCCVFPIPSSSGSSFVNPMTSREPNIDPRKPLEVIGFRKVRRSGVNSSSESFKALLLKKGSCCDPAARISAAERLRSTAPSHQRPPQNQSSQSQIHRRFASRSRLHSSPMTAILERDGEEEDTATESETLAKNVGLADDSYKTFGLVNLTEGQDKTTNGSFDWLDRRTVKINNMLFSSPFALFLGSMTTLWDDRYTSKREICLLNEGSNWRDQTHVSMRSDHSMGRPIYFKEGDLFSEREPVQHLTSSGIKFGIWRRNNTPETKKTRKLLKQKSTASKMSGSEDREEGTTSSERKRHRFQQERPDSPVPSCVSMKSEHSMGRPIYFKEGDLSPERGLLKQESTASKMSGSEDREEGTTASERKRHRFQQERPDSPVPSCVSMKSDHSMGRPIYFKEGDLSPERGRFQHVKSAQIKLQNFLKSHQDIKTQLKQKYQHISEGNQGKITKVNEIYTELYITQSGNGWVSKEHEVRQIEMAFKRENKQEITIKCNDIFKPVKSDYIKRRSLRNLTKGIAGIGKTVSVQKVILDWAVGEANQDIHFMFPLPFRDLNKLKGQYSLMELISFYFPELKEIDSIEGGETKTVLILDSLDECRLPLDFKNNPKCSDVTESASVDVLLTNLIEGNLFPSALLWITTRPAAANRIPPECVDQVTEIRGFNEPQKEEYFRKKIKNPCLAKKIFKHIKSSRTLHIMCHIPVFCWISATVLETVLKQEEMDEIPTSLVQMYSHFILIQTSRKKYKEATETNLKKPSQTAKEMILKLSRLAFQELQKGNLIFYEEDLRECGIDVTEASQYSALCTEIFIAESGLFQEKVFSFVHFSIQEFLAAVHALESCLGKEEHVFHPKADTLLQHDDRKDDGDDDDYEARKPDKLYDLYRRAVDQALSSENGHLDLFLRFLLGLSLKSNQDLLQGILTQTGCTAQQNKGTFKKTEKYLSDKIKEETSPERTINLFHCLNELGANSLVEDMQSSLRSGILSETKLKPHQCSALAYLLLMLEEVLDEFDLKRYNTSEEGIQRLLPVVKNCKRARLDSCNLNFESSKTLGSVLQTPNCLLEELDISYNHMEDRGVTWLCAGLTSPFCNIQTVVLAGCKLTSKSCKTLTSVLLTSNCLLKELDISYNHLEDRGVELLCSGLTSPVCKIQTLVLGHCGLTEVCCSYLASVLRSPNSHMKKLELRDNDLKDSGVIQLSAGLEDPNCKLHALGLSGCLVTERGCDSLAAALRSNPSNLNELDLSYNHLRASDMKLSVGLYDPQWRLEKVSIDHGGEHRLKSGPRKYPCHLTLDPNTACNVCEISQEGNDHRRKVIPVLLRTMFSSSQCPHPSLRHSSTLSNLHVIIQSPSDFKGSS